MKTKQNLFNPFPIKLNQSTAGKKSITIQIKA